MAGTPVDVSVRLRLSMPVVAARQLDQCHRRGFFPALYPEYLPLKAKQEVSGAVT